MPCPKPRGLRLEITEDSQGDYRWSIFDSSGQLSARGCVGYTTKDACIEGLQTLIENLHIVVDERIIYDKSFDPIREETRWRPWR